MPTRTYELSEHRYRNKYNADGDPMVCRSTNSESVGPAKTYRPKRIGQNVSARTTAAPCPLTGSAERHNGSAIPNSRSQTHARDGALVANAQIVVIRFQDQFVLTVLMRLQLLVELFEAIANSWPRGKHSAEEHQLLHLIHQAIDL